MNREQAKENIRSRALEYLKPAKKSGTYICPLCGNGTGEQGDGISSNDGDIHFKCFKCSFYGDIIDLIAEENQLSTAEAFQKAFDVFGVHPDEPQEPTRPQKPRNSNNSHLESTSTVQANTEALTAMSPQNYTQYFLQAKEQLYKTPEAVDYLKHRGISLDTAKKFMLGYDPEWRSPKAVANGKTPPKTKRIIIPSSPFSYTARDINPTADPTYKAIKTGASVIFNQKLLQRHLEKPIFVVEGEFDALSVVEAGSYAVALGSTNNYKAFLKLVEDEKHDNYFVISLDKDKAGEDATKRIIKRLEELKVPYIVENISGEHNDPNAALMAERENFFSRIAAVENNVFQEIEEQRQRRIEAYRDKTSVSAHVQNFIDGIKKSADTPPTPTGFKELDLLLDDGLYSGLYCVGAISSLGKTTFALQIADQIAQSGKDVLIFSLEMSKTELMAKSISRITFLECGGKTGEAKTTRGILSGKKYEKYSKEEKTLINRSVTLYQEYTDHLFIYEGMGDIGAKEIRETVALHTEATGESPVVVIDYLQILAPFDMRATDKQNTDRAVFELKRMSRDFNIPVIAISSINRDAYTSVMSLKSFKESGSIEFSSDVLLGLQFEKMGDDNGATDETINQMKRQEPRKIELKILKNRNGQTGDSISYNYYPRFNYFSEDGKKEREEFLAVPKKAKYKA